MRQFIPVEELFAEWEKNPEFNVLYDALEDEFMEYRRQCLATSVAVEPDKEHKEPRITEAA